MTKNRSSCPKCQALILMDFLMNLLKIKNSDLEATIETTRGCPFGCTFCEIGTKYYQKIKNTNY